MIRDGSKEGRGIVMQCLLISKKGRRYFPALICSTLGAIFRRSISFDDSYRRAILLWAPANLCGVETSSGASGSTTGSRHQFLALFGRPHCRGTQVNQSIDPPLEWHPAQGPDISIPHVLSWTHLRNILPCREQYSTPELTMAEHKRRRCQACPLLLRFPSHVR